ncbi:hypothetical protein PR202_ga25815 [Eleusine coracana subsp. coracana]|uniref:PAP/OAS1 substrate-binding-related domain-containing protein n=1 Tax=Eleusine coracana subsp. coracana TaxID=191504 RepID=A0AAV5DCC3_ELECO|nr:hypothetical protein PR202_ga25815 [Eleusine coracana subsp. coracana]
MAAGGRGVLATAAGREAPGPAAWAVAAAEEAAAEVVRRVRPTVASERRRAEVVDYARRLIGSALGCEVRALVSPALLSFALLSFSPDICAFVRLFASPFSALGVFAYGSVPLKTYLPDGDIDLTILGNTSHDSTLVNDVYCVLDSEDQNNDTEFEVKDLDQINAEVLYRFLEYFSTFDWDNYCISLNGPVALSSLPNLTVEATGSHPDDLLFDKEFLKNSVDEVFVAPRYSGQSGSCYTRFRPKHLNIIDPLKEYNNLGRSVNRASFHRIRTALSFGARKLGQILMLKSEIIPNEIYGFFKNTLGRNGRGFRPDVAGTGAFHSSFGTGKDILEELSSISISYRKGNENGTPHDLSKSLGDNGSYVTNGSTSFSSCLPEGHNTASSTDLWSSHLIHHGPKQYSLFCQENGTGGSEKCDVDCYMDPETKQLSYCTAKTFDLGDRPLIQSRVHVNNQRPTLNSYADVNNLGTEKKSWIAPLMEKQRLPPLSLRLPNLSGDLDLQFRCLRQVQYHLEYLFDVFLQSVQEACSNDKFQKGPFHIPSLNILLDADAALPGLLLRSSVESNGMKLSPVSCSHSTISQHSQDVDPWDVACQQNISLPSVTDIPSNGLSPSSSFIGSDSSIYSSEDSPEMHETDTFFPRKSYDTYKAQLTPSRENGKTLTNHPVHIESNQSSAPVGSFVPHEEQVALTGRTMEITIGQPLKVQGCIHSNRKAVDHSCNPRKEFVRHDNKTRQMPKYHRDICLNMNILQNQQYGTHMEFAQTPSAMWQMPKYQPFNSIQTTAKNCTSASLSWGFPKKQSYGTRKEDEIPDWSARHLPSYEPLKLQNQQRGRVCSKKYSAGKRSYNNHKEDLSFVTGGEHIRCNAAVSNMNDIEKKTSSKKFDENGNQIWPLLQEVPFSLHSTNSQEEPPVSDTSLPSFPITNGPPPETIEFGSLGPFALAFSSSESKEVINTHPVHKVLTYASASVTQRSKASARHSRSPEFCRVGNEDEFPPLNAVVR